MIRSRTTAGNERPPSAIARDERHHRERGSGLFSTSLAVLFFLVFLLLATQVTAHLIATSRLRADADHAARIIASGSVQGGGARVLERAVAAQTAWLTAKYRSGHPTITWVQSTDMIEVDVMVDSPAKLVGALGEVIGIDTLHAHIRMRPEALR